MNLGFPINQTKEIESSERVAYNHVQGKIFSPDFQDFNLNIRNFIHIQENQTL